MHPVRIAELLEPFLESTTLDRGLTTADLARISTYIDILLRWNARINLTAIRDPEQIVTRHFGESLFAARHLFPHRTIASAAERRQNAAHGASRGSAPPTEQAPEGRKSLALTGADQHSSQSAVSGVLEVAAQIQTQDQRLSLSQPERIEATNDRISLADLGSGAGFPGIPIKLWALQISLTLIESNQKKATFLREVARAITLTDINIQTIRAENLHKQNLVDEDPKREVHQDSRPLFDVVTLRAVEHFAEILPVAAALVAPEGRLALLIGSPQQDLPLEVLAAFRWSSPIQIPLSTSRTLLLGTNEPRK
jgi:16S rRNA (guanine(527)-N(7))-methyltransferase RsmG